MEGIVSLLETSSPALKAQLLIKFLERFGLCARVIAREQNPSEINVLQMQGAIEIIVRCLDQRREYEMSLGGRTDATFASMLLEMGDIYKLTVDVRQSLWWASETIKREGMVN